MPKISSLPIDHIADAPGLGEMHLEIDDLPNAVYVVSTFKAFNEKTGCHNNGYLSTSMKFRRDAFIIWLEQCLDELKNK